MIATLFGLMTAIAVAAWGTRWYLQARQDMEPSSSRRAMRRLMQLPPLLPKEAAEQIMQRRKAPSVVEPLPVEEPDLAPLAEEPDEPLPTVEFAAADEGGPPPPVDETVEATVDAVPSTPEDEASDVPAQPDALPASEEHISGYCARCRAKRYLSNIHYTRTSKGKPAIRGACMICGSGMLVFTSEEAWQQQKAAERDAEGAQ